MNNIDIMRDLAENAARSFARKMMHDDEYMDAAIAAIENADTINVMALYNLTARLGTFDAIVVVQAGLELRRQRIFDLSRWQDDGGLCT